MPYVNNKTSLFVLTGSITSSGSPCVLVAATTIEENREMS